MTAAVRQLTNRTPRSFRRWGARLIGVPHEDRCEEVILPDRSGHRVVRLRYEVVDRTSEDASRLAALVGPDRQAFEAASVSSRTCSLSSVYGSWLRSPTTNEDLTPAKPESRCLNDSVVSSYGTNCDSNRPVPGECPSKVYTKCGPI